MNIPENLRYTDSHEWVLFTDENTARIGLTDFAQTSLGSLVFVNLPEVGDGLEVGDSLGDVESVKAVSDVYSPVSGSVSAVNEELLDAPEKINEAPYEAWLAEVSGISAQKDLMSAKEYEAFCEKEA